MFLLGRWFLGWGGGKGFLGGFFYGIALFVGRGTFFWELEKSLYRNLVRFRFRGGRDKLKFAPPLRFFGSLLHQKNRSFPPIAT